MNTDQNKASKGYWLAWFLASVMGYGMGAVLGVSTAYRFFPADAFDAANGLTLGLVMGATGGYFQWVVLRERIAGAGLWALTSALGFALAMGAQLAVDPEENPAMAGFLMGTIFGFVSGILHWLILRQKVPGAGWWLFANLLGSLVGTIAFPFAVIISETGNWTLAILVFGMGFGAGYGAITGATLVRLVRRFPSRDIEKLASAH